MKRNRASLEEEINYLGSLLEKLLKVIQHSDPPAKDKKKILYQKYKSRLDTFGKTFQVEYSWRDARNFILSCAAKNTFQVSKDTRQVVVNRLIKDLESKFYQPPVLEEFTKPAKKEPASPQPLKVPKTRKIPLNPKCVSEQKEFSRDQLMDMVKENAKKRQAQSELASVIEIFRKIGPENIEKKINQYMSSKKPQK